MWHESLDDIPKVLDGGEGVYTMLVAHEFFDALPVHLLEVSILLVSLSSTDECTNYWVC